MIIGISGKLHSGKDTLGRALIEQLGFKRVAFADGVRELVAEIGGWSREYVFSDAFKEQIVQTNVSALGNRKIDAAPGQTTGRELLQRTGMAARKVFGDDIWIKVALRKTERHCLGCGKEERIHFSVGRYENNVLLRNKCVPDALGPIFHTDAPEHYVITDVRFPNELEAIKAAGGRVIRLNTLESAKTLHTYMDYWQGDGEHEGVHCAKMIDGHICGLPPSAHPTSWSADRHASEVSLPDHNNANVHYDAVLTGGMETNTADAVELVKGWL